MEIGASAIADERAARYHVAGIIAEVSDEKLVRVIKPH